MRIVDLFCGMGGVAEAVRGLNGVATGQLESPVLHVVAAVDIDRRTVALYEANHGVTPLCLTIESIQEVPDAELWWMSPPCQPYTQRGRQLGQHDRRSDAFARILELISHQRPEFLAMENVPAFEGSTHHRLLLELLQIQGYSVRWDSLCPTQWGVPMRRNRFYLSARRDGRSIPDPKITPATQPLPDFLNDRDWEDESLRVSRELLSQYSKALNIVDAQDSQAIAACFTSAYGKSPIRSGSYVRCSTRDVTRRFSPAEISVLMGFRDDFVWPADMDDRTRYSLLGNSLSVPVVREVLRSCLHDRLSVPITAQHDQ